MGNIFVDEKESLLKNYFDENILKNASLTLKNDPEVILKFLKSSKTEGDCFIHASPELQYDKQFLLKAIDHHSWVFKHFNEFMKTDFDIALAAVKQNGSLLEFLSEEFQNNKEIVFASIGSYNVEALKLRRAPL
jgi:hypothetical protein